MAVRIRLLRTGAKNQPSYRIVATDSRAKREGKFIEILGHYSPLTSPATVSFDRKRVEYWLSVGAKPTKTVKRLIK